MPVFKVADGTGLSDATSYVSEVFADDFLGSTWAPDSASKQAALMEATQYADLRWGKHLMGRPLNAEQVLEFPRVAIRDRYGRRVLGVPADLMKGVCLYAKQSIAGTLYPVPPAGNAKDIKKKKVTVGPITTEYEYQGLATAATFLPFPLADKLIRQYGYAGNGGTVRN